MSDQDTAAVDTPNRWRLETPGNGGWKHSARPGAENKYFIVSADTHANEPYDLLKKRLPEKWHDRLPRVERDENGVKWQKVEGLRPVRYVYEDGFEGDDARRNEVSADPQLRLKDQDSDGVDAEIIYPNKFLTIFPCRDPELGFAMARAYNDWAWETYGPYRDRLLPMAMIPAMDIELAVAEAQRVIAMGYKGVMMPVRPIFDDDNPKSLQYNDMKFDALWGLLAEAGIPATFHVGTGKDPRTTRGGGAAVTNYVAHAIAPSVELMSHLCGSGVLERFPRLHVLSSESGCGWIPWAAAAMDEAYLKHHMWAFPKLKELPSHYMRTQCHGTFVEDRAALLQIEPLGFEKCFMWSNDYPHHEGSWPHSYQSIERQMGHLSEDTRARVLGLNAAERFGIEPPASARR